MNLTIITNGRIIVSTPTPHHTATPLPQRPALSSDHSHRSGVVLWRIRWEDAAVRGFVCCVLSNRTHYLTRTNFNTIITD